jgi:general nucleoside transport system ATP-binding protein
LGTGNAFEFQSITKAFGPVVANASVSFGVARGTIHAVVGENGAGKSTIMKILYGMYAPDEGKILVESKHVDFRSPQDAIQSGIGMVHQHFMLVPTLPVWQNVVLGQEPGSWYLSRSKSLKALQAIRDEFGLQVDLLACVEDLPVGQQQQVEILKLLYRKAEILILDEPTAVLTPQEVTLLLDRLKRLRDLGKTIVFISHKLKEILSFAQNVTIMRQGKVVETLPTQELTEALLAEKMVGRKLLQLPVRRPVDMATQPRIQIQNLTAYRQGQKKLDQIALMVRPGEILGIAGVDGNGQNELVEVLMNTFRDYQGEVLLDGMPLKDSNTYELKQTGLAVIPPDRLKQAVILDFSVKENFILGHHWEQEYVRRGIFQTARIQSEVEKALDTFDVRPRQPEWPMSGLSGGNQQKVVLAREFARPVRLLVAAQPTRGVDIGAIEFIHSQFIQKRDEGAAILLISTELEEILQLSDRIAVMYEGRIQGECLRADADEGTLGLWMTGGKSMDRAGVRA